MGQSGCLTATIWCLLQCRMRWSARVHRSSVCAEPGLRVASSSTTRPSCLPSRHPGHSSTTCRSRPIVITRPANGRRPTTSAGGETPTWRWTRAAETLSAAWRRWASASRAQSSRRRSSRACRPGSRSRSTPPYRTACTTAGSGVAPPGTTSTCRRRRWRPTAAARATSPRPSRGCTAPPRRPSCPAARSATSRWRTPPVCWTRPSLAVSQTSFCGCLRSGTS